MRLRNYDGQCYQCDNNGEAMEVVLGRGSKNLPDLRIVLCMACCDQLGVGLAEKLQREQVTK